VKASTPGTRQPDPAAFAGFSNIAFTADLKPYAYSVDGYPSALYLVQGLK